MIQGQFPRLKDPLLYEEFGERKMILNVMVLLYNFQTTRVGINDILNSFKTVDETANNVFNNTRLQIMYSITLMFKPKISESRCISYPKTKSESQ